MELKKQLILVPPMSGTLIKINEVLETVSTEENIEISIIDDLKEITQFIGSAGQCLMMFSNIKKCANFLQENKTLISKNRSKVILLTHAEIPPATLIKFQKIGLTEAILDNTLPKTILYKVKLLLRSIKTSSPDADKEAQIKSLTNGETPEASENYKTTKIEKKSNFEKSLPEEETNKKKKIESETIDYRTNKKNKSNYEEESIETNWKSDRKTDGNNSEDDEFGNTKVKNDNLDNIDLYLRGKSKLQNDDLLENVDEESAHKIALTEEVSEEVAKKKKFIELELENTKSNRERISNEDEQGDLKLKTKKDDFTIEEADKLPNKSLYLTEEEKQEALNKELDEFDALISSAKKRQAELQAEEDGFLKVKNLGLEEEIEEENLKEDLKYDNIELEKKKKNFELELEDAKKNKNDQEEDFEHATKNKKKKNQDDLLDNNPLMSESEVDKISTLMKGKASKDGSKKISIFDVYNSDSNKDNEPDLKEESELKKKKLELVPDEEDESRKKNTLELEDGEDQERKRETKLNLKSDEEDDKNKAELDLEDEEKNRRDKLKNDSLELADSDRKREKMLLDEVDPNITYKKLGQDGESDEIHGNQIHDGKVDQIDTFYRSNKARTVEHSWDGLGIDGLKNDSTDEKKQNRKDEMISQLEKKNSGEITIDYRKLKKEFDEISRGEYSLDEDGNKIKSSRNSADDDDEGIFKVIDINPKGFDFAINILNLIYKSDAKPIDLYKSIAEELIVKYHGHSAFYNYKKDNKPTETFDSFKSFDSSLCLEELKIWWTEFLSNQEILEAYSSKSLTTWSCREIEDKSDSAGKFWEDVELPKWAANELNDKRVELVYPYYDGLDRMGFAVVIFPNGITPENEMAITVTLEMARTLMLEEVIRVKTSADTDESSDGAKEDKKSGGFFKGLFNKNKTG